jgi:hypothetical protein
LTKTRLFVASCLWLAACGSSVWGADMAVAPAALFIPPSISSLQDTDSSLHLSVEDFRSAPFRSFFSPAFGETDPTLPGLQARYQMGLTGDSLEVSGGYVPGVKESVPSESRIDPDAYLGYVKFKIPLHRFHLSGGAFFGQNMDALTLISQSPSDERPLQRSLFGYQIGGGYKFSDTLSIQAKRTTFPGTILELGTSKLRSLWDGASPSRPRWDSSTSRTAMEKSQKKRPSTAVGGGRSAFNGVRA